MRYHDFLHTWDAALPKALPTRERFPDTATTILAANLRKIYRRPLLSIFFRLTTKSATGPMANAYRIYARPKRCGPQPQYCF